MFHVRVCIFGGHFKPVKMTKSFSGVVSMVTGNTGHYL